MAAAPLAIGTGPLFPSSSIDRHSPTMVAMRTQYLLPFAVCSVVSAATIGCGIPGTETDMTVEKCNPTGGGPFWIEEGETVTTRIKCGTGLALTGAEFRVTHLPKGADYDSETRRLTWKTRLDSAGVYFVKVTAIPSGEETEIKIGVADNFDHPNNVPIVNPRIYTEEFGIPVFYIEATPLMEIYHPLLRMRQTGRFRNGCDPTAAGLAIGFCGPSFFSPATLFYRGKEIDAEVKWRGASTLSLPKRHIGLRFSKEQKFSEPFAGGGEMIDRRYVALIQHFDDNSHVRWRLAFELWNRLHPRVAKLHSFTAAVYLNGSYIGLYTASDRIDDRLAERNGLSKDGQIFMGFNHNASFEWQVRHEASGPLQNMVRDRFCPHEGFEKKEGEPKECDEEGNLIPGAYDALLPLIEFIAKSEDAQFAAEVGKVVDLDDYIGWFVFSTAIVANDSFGKNAVHYIDPAGGPWRLVLWDYNASFGQAWNTKRTPPDFDPLGPMNRTAMQGGSRNYLWKRLWDNPTYQAKMKEMYASTIRNQLKEETVLEILDELVKETRPAAYRDERRWFPTYEKHWGPESSNKREDLTNVDEEADYLRDWISKRWEHLRSLFP
jgi:spore coat protein H